MLAWDWAGHVFNSVQIPWPWSVPTVGMWEFGSVRVGPRVQLRALHASSQSLAKRIIIGNVVTRIEVSPVVESRCCADDFGFV